MSSLETLGAEIARLTHEGGWVFLSLIVLAFGIAFALLSLWHSMHLPGAPLLSSREWLSLLQSKKRNSNAFANLERHLQICQDPARKLDELGERLFALPKRRFSFAFILISAAPLIGLLGTVSGMFTTFRGMAIATAASPIDVISDGISEALITTQTGLIIGVPTYVVCAWLQSRHNELVIRYQQLQSQMLQRLSS